MHDPAERVVVKQFPRPRRGMPALLRPVLPAAGLTLLTVLSPWPNIRGQLESASINAPPRPQINNLGLPIGFVRVVNGRFERIAWGVATFNLACWYAAILFATEARRILAVDRTVVRQRAGRCPGCGYDLRGSPTRCPECGRPRELTADGKSA